MKSLNKDLCKEYSFLATQCIPLSDLNEAKEISDTDIKDSTENEHMQAPQAISLLFCKGHTFKQSQALKEIYMDPLLSSHYCSVFI